MTDPTRRQDLSEEDDALWAMLGAIHRTLTREGEPIGTDEAQNQLRHAMYLLPSNGLSQPSSAWGRLKARVIRLTGTTEAIEACFNWLRKTGVLTDKDLVEARRGKMFYQETETSVLMRSKGLNLTTAMAAIATITFLAGIWAGWVLFGPRSGIQMIANSLIVGSFLGVIICRILDRSFRFERIRAKVRSIAPWLIATPFQ